MELRLSPLDRCRRVPACAVAVALWLLGAFASLDLAGNFSGWSEPERFAASDSPAGKSSAYGDACSVRGVGLRATPGLEPTALGACAVLALGVRRRRPRA